jgi:hypothetical protein
LNNNNSTRVNLNQRPAEEQEQPAAAEGEEQPATTENEAEPLIEPQVPLMTIVRTFVLSFFSSIIPEAPALWMNVSIFAAIYAITYLLMLFYKNWGCRGAISIGFFSFRPPICVEMCKTLLLPEEISKFSLSFRRHFPTKARETP